MNSVAILILKAIINGTYDDLTLKKISGVKEWQFNKHVKRLHQTGYVQKEESKIVLQENAKTSLLWRISRSWNLENILHDSNELVLSYMIEPLTVNELVTKTGLSAVTVYRTISDLRAVGLVQEITAKNVHSNKISKKIHLDPNKKNLIDFARILETERLNDTDEVVYTDKEKTLKKVTKGKIIKGELTSFSAFPDYGIQYDSPHDYYILNESPPDINYVVIHSVLTSYMNDDKLELIMSIVFYVHNKNRVDTKKLREIAASFDILAIWVDVEAYIRRQNLKHKNLFLPWHEFVSKAKLYGIDPEKYDVPEPVPSLFEDIGLNLASPMSIFLIGGENMRLKNLKATTKDCDIVVETLSDFKILYETLKNMGYHKIANIEYSEDDQRLYPSEILEYSGRSRIDLFTKKIMRNMSLSDVMIETADYLMYGNLKVGVLRNEYVFLLKAVAGREGDIQDMQKLCQGSLNPPTKFDHGRFNWDEVWLELIHQEKINPLRDNAYEIYEQLCYLTEQTGIIAPIFDKFRIYVLEQKILKSIRSERQPLKKIVYNLNVSRISDQMIRNRIDSLVKFGTVRKYTVGKNVFVERTNIPHFPCKDQSITSENMDIYLQWRFPWRQHATPPAIQTFTTILENLGFSSLGYLDDIVVTQLDQFLEYESQLSLGVPSNSLEAVKVCIGLFDPKLVKSIRG